MAVLCRNLLQGRPASVVDQVYSSSSEQSDPVIRLGASDTPYGRHFHTSDSLATHATVGRSRIEDVEWLSCYHGHFHVSNISGDLPQDLQVQFVCARSYLHSVMLTIDKRILTVCRAGIVPLM